MRRMLLAAAAAVVALAATSPSSAQSYRSVPQRLSGKFGSEGGASCGAGMDRSHFRGGRCGDVVMDWYGGEWALYNNRSWQPDSYNDWWHDRPDRAFPRWMSNNQDCQRRWFAGDVLRC